MGPPFAVAPLAEPTSAPGDLPLRRPADAEAEERRPKPEGSKIGISKTSREPRQKTKPSALQKQ